MPVRIRNLSSTLIYVPLHNGDSVRLAPGELSPPVHEVQVKGHAKVDKLLDRRMIAIDSKEEPKPANGKADDESTGTEVKTRPRATKSA